MRADLFKKSCQCGSTNTSGLVIRQILSNQSNGDSSIDASFYSVSLFLLTKAAQIFIQPVSGEGTGQKEPPTFPDKERSCSL